MIFDHPRLPHLTISDLDRFSMFLQGKCSRCQQSDQMMSQEARRAELMEKLDVFKEEKAKHKWRKDRRLYLLAKLWPCGMEMEWRKLL